LSLAHATYYLRIARRYNKVSSDQWAALDEEWGNIRKAFDFLAAKFEQRLDMSAEEALARIDDLAAVPISPQFGEILILLRDYALTLRKYIVLRHPPEGYHWLAAGMVAARILGTAYTQAGNQTDHSRQTEALLGKGLAAMAFIRQDYETAQIWYCNSLLYFREAEDHRRTVEVLRSLGMVLQAMGLLDEALSTYQDGLQVATADGLDDERAAIQAEIGAIYYEKQDFDQAVEWHQKALELEQEIDRPSGQAERHNDLGRTLEAINLFEQAIQHYTIAAQLYQTMNDNFGLSVTYDNLGAVYYHSGRLKEALAWYEQDLAIIDGLGNWFDMAAILHNMGHVAMDMDDFQAAVGYFTRSRDIYLQFGQLELADEEQLLIDTIQDRHT
jgi:tetratricopeptide (TPR) repeat protein